jgi:hypothetical protein
MFHAIAGEEHAILSIRRPPDSLLEEIFIEYV